MGLQDMPAAEVDIDPGLARRLLAEQHPDLADLPIAELANGWDNVVFRLGDDLTIRLPRRQLAARLVEHEQRWLPDLAPRLPIAIPAPVRDGRPGLGYPWAWSVTPWFPGTMAAETALADHTAEAERLGAFCSALHVPAPVDAPDNPYRGHFIGHNAPVFAARVDRLASHLDRIVDDGAARTRHRWTSLTEGVEPHRGPATWLHGDLHTANLLVDGGRIAAVIDFGDITSGDPAVDLAVAWMAFGPHGRDRFRHAASEGPIVVDESMWRRAEAWALHLGIAYLVHSADNPLMGDIGDRVIRAVVDGAG